MNAYSLSADALAVAFSGRYVFHSLDFTARPGDAIWVKGQNGSGKTSLLRALGGMIPLSCGTINLGGTTMAGGLGGYAAYIGTENAIKAGMRVAAMLRFWAGFCGATQQQIRTAVEAFALGPLLGLQIAMLSNGQKRRVALSRLRIIDRPIWLLDEPLGGLDQAGCTMLERAACQHRSRGGVIIVATHQPIHWPALQIVALDADRNPPEAGNRQGLEFVSRRDSAR
ncbi:MAG: heme ABC exporter ATP-binding protein CcmA [Pseudomonadota bacterium]